MASIDPLFGIHADALTLQRQRMEVLSANIANADTPHYLARDIDFSSVLASAAKSAEQAAGPVPPSELAGAGMLTTTNPLHISASTPDSMGNPALVYRVPMQPSVDGNTVDEQVEQAKFADAALHYEASLTFMNGEIRNLTTAITGS